MNSITELKESRFDTIYDSQKIFRILMNAIAFPGRIHKLPEIYLSGIEQKYVPVIIPILTVLDLETSFNIFGDDIEEIKKIIKYIEINTGAVYRDLNDIDYCISLNKSLGSAFKLLNIGRLEEPDKSTTLFYFINNLSNTDNENITILLTGPGIKDEELLSINGLAKAEIDKWIDDRTNYPLGIDIFLIDQDGNIAGLPRSTKIRIKG